MKKKKEIISENYLERIPVPNGNLRWKSDEDGKITLLIENTGFFNKMAQKFFKKPKTTFVHLDDMGSFIWPLMDGERDIIEIGKLVQGHFGEAANPLYERLAKFFKVLESYNFIEWK